MSDNGVTAFGGIVGRVLRDATSIGTAVTAFVLAAAVLIVSLTFNLLGIPALAQLFVQVVVAVALARFTLNGLSGEFRGTILSTAGGPWALAFAVALRYLVLNLLWVAPAVLALWLSVSAAMSGAAAPGGAGEAAPAAPAGGLALALPIVAILTSKAVIASLVFLLVGFSLLPPTFLIVAVRAERFAEIFTAGHWRSAFAGRFADLYVIYAIHAGGIGMMVILAIPVMLLAFSAASDFGKVFAFLAFAYTCSLAITLLGRLCGFFAFGEESTGPVRAFPPAGEDAEVPRAAVGFEPRIVRGGGAGPAAVAVDAAGPQDADGDAGVASVMETETAGVKAAAPAIRTADTPGPAGRPPLPDAAERAAAARNRFVTDGDGAIDELRGLHDGHAPNGPVMHALALCLHEAGRVTEAIDMARQAARLCLATGQAPLAAELFAVFWKQAKQLGLDHAQIDAVASVFMKSGDLARAVSAYGLALTMDPNDRKAVKGLLQAADQRLYKDGRPRDAAKIYTFLLQYSSNSPFSEDMRRGLSEAESRLARAS
jgi:hypothetical protein